MTYARAVRSLSTAGRRLARASAGPLFALATATAIAGPAAAGGPPAPDIKVSKACHLDPSKGPTAIFCTIDVFNVGGAPSVAPVNIVDTINAPAGTTFTSASGSFGCSTPTGAAPAVINCSGPHSLAIGGPTAYASSGTTFLYFKLPAKGGTFSNCASATTGQSPTVPRDPIPANNTNICARIIVKGSGGAGPPDVTVGKECKQGANRSVTCAIRVTNTGSVPTVAPLVLTDTISNVLPGTLYTGASGNVACPGPGPYAAPINCTIVSPIPGGQSITVLLSFTVKGKGTFQNSAKVTQGGAVAEANVANNTSNVKVTMP